MTSVAVAEVGTGPAPSRPGELTFSSEQKGLIKDTIARDQNLTDDELRLFLYIAQRRGLDPLAKQMYAIRRKGKIVYQTSIDAFRLVATRTGAYAGRDRPVFEGQVEVKNLPAFVPEIAVFTVYKLVGGVRCAFTSEARWSEFYPGPGNDGFMWREKPHLMLAKCAEAQALRAAFPEELGGLYTGEEMDQAGTDVEAVVVDPLTAAVNMVLPGESGKSWGGWSGKTLGEVPTKMLLRVQEWVTGKLQEGDERETLVVLADSIRLVLEARAAGTLPEPVKPEPVKPEQETTPDAAPREPGEENE